MIVLMKKYCRERCKTVSNAKMSCGGYPSEYSALFLPMRQCCCSMAPELVEHGEGDNSDRVIANVTPFERDSVEPVLQ